MPDKRKRKNHSLVWDEEKKEWTQLKRPNRPFNREGKALWLEHIRGITGGTWSEEKGYDILTKDGLRVSVKYSGGPPTTCYRSSKGYKYKYVKNAWSFTFAFENNFNYKEKFDYVVCILGGYEGFTKTADIRNRTIAKAFVIPAEIITSRAWNPVGQVTKQSKYHQYDGRFDLLTGNSGDKGRMVA